MPTDASGRGRAFPIRFPWPAAPLLLVWLAAVAIPAAAAAADAGRPVAPDRLAPTAIAPAVVAAPGAATFEGAKPGDAPSGAAGPRARRPLSPLAADLARAIEAERVALAALQARFDRAASEREALAVQREIEQLKSGTEVTLLRIQARHARLKGREAAARRMDEAIEAILHPPVPRAPVERPEPLESGAAR